MAKVLMKYQFDHEGTKVKCKPIAWLTEGSSCKTQNDGEMIKEMLATPVEGFGELSVDDALIEPTDAEAEEILNDFPSITMTGPEQSAPGDSPPDSGGTTTQKAPARQGPTLGFGT